MVSRLERFISFIDANGTFTSPDAGHFSITFDPPETIYKFITHWQPSIGFKLCCVVLHFAYGDQYSPCHEDERDMGDSVFVLFGAFGLADWGLTFANQDGSNMKEHIYQLKRGIIAQLPGNRARYVLSRTKMRCHIVARVAHVSPV